VIVFALKALVDYIRGPEAVDPTLWSLGLGRARRAKKVKVSANGCSLVEAEVKPKPVVITPVGSTARSRRKPSYHPRLLDHPMSAY
jgi:hypothetical protein